jgi:hypothetical protein
LFLNLKEADLNKKIYRIISLSRLEELFETRRNVLVKPHKWEDPFENFILRSKVKLPTGEIIEYNFHNWLYGQCWSFHKASDAMWRIYSPKSDGVRIRTTLKKLAESFFQSQKTKHEFKCAIGKVLYLKEKELKDYANNTFDDYGITLKNLFSGLLVKRPAFKHENEVRLLYCSIDDNEPNSDIFSYVIEPHSLITQIMIDPRLDQKKANSLKNHIKNKTKFKGDIRRSLLYSFKNDMILDAKKIDIATENKISEKC